MAAFIIEDNIPVPARPTPIGAGRPPGAFMQTLLKLQPGQSFMAPDMKSKAAASRFKTVCKTLPDAKFTARAVEGGTRVWRVA